jgi:hypothetical protein
MEAMRDEPSADPPTGWETHFFHFTTPTKAKAPQRSRTVSLL